MKYGKVPGVEKRVSRLVQGTVMVTSKEIDKSFALLDAVWELGCNTFDTAAVYGMGDCERTVGRWIAERGIREKVVLIGKGAHPDGDRRRVTPADITADIHDSLGRFKTDSIDLYLLHRDDPSAPVGPIVEVLNEHRKAGRICAFGGSNWSHERIGEANEYAASRGLTGFAASSPNLSLAEQVNAPWPGCLSVSGARGEAAREWYRKKKLALFAWSSLAGGFFSGRFRRDNLGSFNTYFEKLCVECYCVERNFQRFDRAEKLAREKGLSVAQVALAYVRSQPLNLFALVGCASGAEFKQNVEALDLELTADEMAWLDLRSDER
jgi:aryl-alcohol dehydrogenase-like predicted oxidoreductase